MLLKKMSLFIAVSFLCLVNVPMWGAYDLPNINLEQKGTDLFFCSLSNSRSKVLRVHHSLAHALRCAHGRTLLLKT